MAQIAIFTSGNGSNFQAIVEHINATSHHRVVLMVCNRREAYSFTRAKQLGVEAYYLSYGGRDIKTVEQEIIGVLKDKNIDLIVLAGFMKLLSSTLIDAFPNRIINIHPTLLPKYPGAHGIKESYQAQDDNYGITIHYVDYGMDSGSIITQRALVRDRSMSLDDFEASIHRLEHETYPKVVEELLDKIDIKTRR